ncbi:MAG: ribosome assembly RNA-binding protein YhbY [Oscillospiraceae bacterium]|nr:ribosome assembly RNA-binding protein YhbY [Oscillospiraceae bacterium]
MALTSKQRAYLRSIGHVQNAIFQVGKGGINDNFIKQISDALDARELIKITVLETALSSAREVCGELCEAVGAEPVQCIGNKLIIYRESAEKKKEGKSIVLPK